MCFEDVYAKGPPLYPKHNEVALSSPERVRGRSETFLGKPVMYAEGPRGTRPTA